MKKSIFVYIDSSLGELHWISPFLSSRYANSFDITIFTRKVILSDKILTELKLDKNNIRIFREIDVFCDNRISRFFIKQLNSILKKINRFNSSCKYFNKIKMIVFKKVITKISLENNFDFIFRDTGFHESFEISLITSLNPRAKVIAFPHCVNIGKAQKNKVEIIKNKCIEVDLILENTILSKEKIENQKFYISGTPALSTIKEKRYDFNSNNVLILTRDVYEPYGCSRNSFLKTFKQILDLCDKDRLKVYVKHHPRDKQLDDYRFIQNQYNNVIETNEIFNETKFRICLSAYSTAGIYITSEQIPVFDISPYEKCTEYLTDHFCDTNGYYTHDLIELGLQSKLNNFDIILDEEQLDDYSLNQFIALKKYFPLNANENIFNKLNELDKLQN